MNKVKISTFKTYKVVTLLRKFYINQVNENEFIKIGDEKFFMIQKAVLIKMGMTFEKNKKF